MNKIEREAHVSDALAASSHIDDTVDRFVEEFGWDVAFLTLAEMSSSRAAVGMHSLVCGLLLEHEGL